jgi:hypothetical protein
MAQAARATSAKVAIAKRNRSDNPIVRAGVSRGSGWPEGRDRPEGRATRLELFASLRRPELAIVLGLWGRGFRLRWAWKGRRRMGQPNVPADVRALIRTMANANPR